MIKKVMVLVILCSSVSLSAMNELSLAQKKAIAEKIEEIKRTRREKLEGYQKRIARLLRKEHQLKKQVENDGALLTRLVRLINWGVTLTDEQKAQDDFLSQELERLDQEIEATEDKRIAIYPLIEKLLADAPPYQMDTYGRVEFL
jgi:hypothetical protein